MCTALTNSCSFRPREYDTDVQRWDPLTAGASSTLGTITNFTASLGGTFIDPYKEYKRVRSTGGNHAGLSAAGAAGKGFVGMGGAVTKGMLVDVPLALTEGLRNTPRLYGDHVEDHGKVKDWKSGGVVAAKVCPFFLKPNPYNFEFLESNCQL